VRSHGAPLRDVTDCAVGYAAQASRLLEEVGFDKIQGWVVRAGNISGEVGERHEDVRDDGQTALGEAESGELGFAGLVDG